MDIYTVVKGINLVGRAMVVLAVVALLAVVAQAAQVTLAWDANAVPPDGYRIYARTADGYGQVPVWEGDGLKTTCTINDLDDARQTAFVATAFVRGGIDGRIIESGHSNEVVFTPPGMVPEAPRNLLQRLLEALSRAWRQWVG